MEARKNGFHWPGFVGGFAIGALAAFGLPKLVQLVAPGITKTELARVSTIAFGVVLGIAVSRAFRARAARKKATELGQGER